MRGADRVGVVDRQHVHGAVTARFQQPHQLLQHEERVVLLDVLEGRDRVDVVERIARERHAQPAVEHVVRARIAPAAPRVLDHHRRDVETAREIRKRDAAEYLRVTLNEGVTDGSFIPDLLLKNDMRLKMLKEEEIDLEDVFMGITKGITN